MKKTLMQQLKKVYIPPLSNLYYERIALEKVVFGVPLFVRMSDPESWLINEPYVCYKQLSAEALEQKLKYLLSYLKGVPDGTIFDGERVLSLHEPIPYIEWHSAKGISSSASLLGKYTLCIDLSEFDDDFSSLSKVINAIQSSLGDILQLVLIGSIEMQLSFNQYKNIIFIAPDKTANLSFSERFKFKNKNSLTLFNFGSRPYFLVNESGYLMTFFGKQDQLILIEEIKRYIQLDQL